MSPRSTLSSLLMTDDEPDAADIGYRDARTSVYAPQHSGSIGGVRGTRTMWPSRVAQALVAERKPKRGRDALALWDWRTVVQADRFARFDQIPREAEPRIEGRPPVVTR